MSSSSIIRVIAWFAYWIAAAELFVEVCFARTILADAPGSGGRIAAFLLLSCFAVAMLFANFIKYRNRVKILEQRLKLRAGHANEIEETLRKKSCSAS